MKLGVSPLACLLCLYFVPVPQPRLRLARVSCPERVRVISIARLRTLPPVHLRPIDVIVFDGPLWRSYLEGGFVLRCFQHLSWPEAATRRCGWRHNRFTGAPSDTVLSY